MRLEKGMRVTLKQCDEEGCKCQEDAFKEGFLGKSATITTMRGKNITVTLDELYEGILRREIHVRKPKATEHLSRVYTKPPQRGM